VTVRRTPRARGPEEALERRWQIDRHLGLRRHGRDRVVGADADAVADRERPQRRAARIGGVELPDRVGGDEDRVEGVGGVCGTVTVVEPTNEQELVPFVARAKRGDGDDATRVARLEAAARVAGLLHRNDRGVAADVGVRRRAVRSATVPLGPFLAFGAAVMLLG